jgi:hypothetical protein
MSAPIEDVVGKVITTLSGLLSLLAIWKKPKKKP